MSKKKVLIFGIGGFVGPYLAREFQEHGYDVIGSDLQKTAGIPDFADFHACDLLSTDSVESLASGIQPQAIVNLAAISNVGLSWKIPQKTVAVNVEGSLNILESARKMEEPPKVLLIGSSEEYEIISEPINEDCKLNANNPYGISKIMQEEFSKLYREKFGMKIYHVRAFNHTGVGQNDSFVIPSWCKQVAEISKSGKPGVMKVGNLDVKRDFSHVKDIVRAYRMVLESDDSSIIYNIGSGTATLLKDLLIEITSLSGQQITIEQDSALFRPADNLVICCDNRLIREKIGWKMEYTLLDAVREIYEDFL